MSASIVAPSRHCPAPAKPAFPEGRVVHEALAGPLFFASDTELQAWKKEPWWRKLFGVTAYDRRLARKPE